jgi:hypothetical protein
MTPIIISTLITGFLYAREYKKSNKTVPTNL